MGEKTEIAWTDSTFNPWLGCQRVSPGCDNCLAPDTLVLYRDWTWHPLGEVSPGDKLLGFPDSNKVLMRRLEVSTVEKIWAVKERALEIQTPEHKIICSYDHPFVARKAAFWRWRKPRNFSLLNTYLRTLPVNPLKPFTHEYMKGYLSGSTEGDGTFRLDPQKQSYWRVAVVKTQESFLERLADFLRALDIADLEVKPFSNGLGSAMIRIETRQYQLLEKIKEVLNMAQGNVHPDFARGWLAGMFDAEGNSGITQRKDRPNKIKLNSLRIANTVVPRLEKIVQYGKITGFDFKIEKFSRNCSTARLSGGAIERGRFYGAVRPAIEYKVDACLQTGIPAKAEQVIGMTDVGETNLINIQTSTGTFFANGFAVHNCYAETMANRRKWVVWGPQGERRRTKPANWRNPIIWDREARETGLASRVFCASLADVFDNQAPEGAREDLWELIKATPNLQWQILTKRPQNFEEMLPTGWPDGYDHVWLGVSAENQEEYDRRWPLLARSGASVKFISYEPALRALSIRETEAANHGHPDWLIWGGESGPGARPLKPEWIRDIIQECQDLGVILFGKQWGSYESNPLVAEQAMSIREAMNLDPKTNGKGGAMLDGKMPAREFPRSRDL